MQHWARSGGRAVAWLLLGATLHVGFCEWRGLAYPQDPAEQSTTARGESRFFRLWRTLHAEGNAAAWDLRDTALRAYNAAWLVCVRDLLGPAGAQMAVCLDHRSFPIRGTTAEAVARGECERELFGGVRQERDVKECTRRTGFVETHVPRWTFERVGRRFEGPWVEEITLLPEPFLAAPGWRRVAGFVLGVGLPGACVWMAAREFRRCVVSGDQVCHGSRRGPSAPGT